MPQLPTQLSPLLRLPQELRDQIYNHAFHDSFLLPSEWNIVDDSDPRTLYRILPGICRANRQLYFEATPVFLARDTYFSMNTETSRQTLDLFNQFSEDVFKRVTDFAIYNWTEEGTQVQVDLITRFSNLTSLEIVFGFPGIIDGKTLYRFDCSIERNLWLETGLHYVPREGRTIEEEKEMLRADVQAFIAKYKLDQIITMPKLKHLRFQFATDKGQVYRHRLCNPLWRWAMEMMKQQQSSVLCVDTKMAEHYKKMCKFSSGLNNKPYENAVR
jgi:hypothetical protein